MTPVSMTMLPCGCRLIIAPGSPFHNMHDFCKQHMDFLFGSTMAPYFREVIKTILAAHTAVAAAMVIPTTSEPSANDPTNPS